MAKSLILVEEIEPRILLLRGQKILLDADLAHLYGSSTKKLRQDAVSTPSHYGCRSSGPLLQRHIRLIAFAYVDLLGPEDAVVLELLEPVGEPAGDAGDGEDGGEEVGGDAEGLIDD